MVGTGILTTHELVRLYGANLTSSERLHIEKVIYCESRDNPAAIGDDGISIGLVQINLKAHPDITRKEALNDAWAVKWMVGQWQKGRAWMWTCARILGYLSSSS